MPGAPGVLQWVQLSGGRWISEKDPGYPFLATPFQAAGIIRGAPLFSGALGCLGLFFGARRWLGRYGGPAAVVLFCSSGAALLFGRGDEAGAADMFFDWRIADLAMGSAHFLVAVIDRIEAKFTAFLTEEQFPAVSDELARLSQAAHAALGEYALNVELARL